MILCDSIMRGSILASIVMRHVQSPDDAGQTTVRRSRRAGRDEGREQDVAEISRRMYDEIRSSRDPTPRDHVEDVELSNVKS